MDDLVEHGLDLYRDATRALHERGAPLWHRVELSVAQLRALFTLVDASPMPIGRLASHLGIGLPAASSLVDRLVDQGLACRMEDREDRRRTLARPTPSGEALAQSLRQGSREALRSWLERMEPGDLASLVRGLRALVAAASSPSRGAGEDARVAVGD